MSSSPDLIDVVILTILPEEYDAVCRQLANVHSSAANSTANLYAWQIGEVASSHLGGTYSVAFGMTGRAGNPQSALATTDAIQRWKPRYIFFVGIAGGLGLNKGDVVISDVIHGYNYGKLAADFQPRDNWTYKTDLGLLNGANAYALRPTWRERLRSSPPTACTPAVIAGEVASGDQVVDDPTNAFFAAVLKRWPKIKAVEMEGAGASAAIEQAQAYGHRVGFMMIRGISDVPRPPQTDAAQGTVERDDWKPFASETAAAFTVGLIAHGLPESPRTSISGQTAAASVAITTLLNPFGDTGKIEDPARYLVRQPLTREVFDELRKGGNVSIVGESQTGKSSLLCYIQSTGATLLNRPARDFIYLDLELIHSDSEFYEALCADLGLATCRGIRLARALKGRKVVLCLDEAEKMLCKTGLTVEFRGELRGLADGQNAPLSLVIASRSPLGHLFPDATESTSPLASICLSFNMPPFTLDEAQALVAHRLNGTGALPAEGVAHAWQTSHGHPGRLQQALRETYDRMASNA